MIDLADFKKMTPEQLAAMNEQERYQVHGKLALSFIANYCRVLGVAFDSREITIDDLATVVAVEKHFKEMLQKFYPNGGW